MVKESITFTENGKREVTITLPLKRTMQNKAITENDYDDYLQRKTQVLSYDAFAYDLTLTLYKVPLQSAIVFNYRGSEENIQKFISKWKPDIQEF